MQERQAQAEEEARLALLTSQAGMKLTLTQQVHMLHMQLCSHVCIIHSISSASCTRGRVPVQNAPKGSQLCARNHLSAWSFVYIRGCLSACAHTTKAHIAMC